MASDPDQDVFAAPEQPFLADIDSVDYMVQVLVDRDMDDSLEVGHSLADSFGAAKVAVAVAKNAFTYILC